MVRRMLFLCLGLILILPVARAAGQAELDNPNDYTDVRAQSASGKGIPGRVIGDLNLRTAPVVSDDTLIRTLENNDPVDILETVVGDDGDEWYRIGESAFVHAADVRVPSAPPETFSGRWIDVDLSTPALLTAYEDDEPVFSALAIKGRTATETPPGTHTIVRRVADETMDSRTVGIPRNNPNGYYLEHVLYTQYFTDDGASIHYNYWSDNFGDEGSHGCVGVSLQDAEWLWDWADVGTVVNIHD